MGGGWHSDGLPGGHNLVPVLFSDISNTTLVVHTTCGSLGRLTVGSTALGWSGWFSGWLAAHGDVLACCILTAFFLVCHFAIGSTYFNILNELQPKVK